MLPSFKLFYCAQSKKFVQHENSNVIFLSTTPLSHNRAVVFIFSDFSLTLDKFFMGALFGYKFVHSDNLLCLSPSLRLSGRERRLGTTCLDSLRIRLLLRQCSQSTHYDFRSRGLQGGQIRKGCQESSETVPFLSH